MRPRNFLCHFLLVAGLIPAAAETGRLDKTGFRARDGGWTRNFAVVQEGGTTVLYEKVRGRTAAGRRVVTTGGLVRLKDPGGAVKLAETAEASSWRKAPALADGVILEFAGRSSEILTLVETLRTLPQVLAADPLLARQQVKRWIPNDPLFGDNPASAGYQWHLNNTGQNGGTAGVDIHVTAVWDDWKG